MNIIFLLQFALRSLMRNKLRSSLTMLGVIIGVASVVAMVAIGEGAKESIQKTIASMGSGYFYVRPGAVSSKGVSFGAGTVNTLTVDDGEAVVEECPSVVAMSPVVRHRVQLVYGDKNWSPDSMEGVSASYSRIKEWYAIQGSWFTEQDVRSAAKVCMIGTTIKKELFPFANPVGKTIRVGHVPMEVVGVLAPRGSNVWGSDQDSSVFVPWTTMRMRLLSKKKKKSVERLIMRAKTPGHMEMAKAETTKVIRARHKLRDDQPNDFRVFDLSRWTSSYAETSQVMSVLLSVIASISLLVGGIGIMNIMLVSVSERTREIGVRMAVGAQSKHILSQFLTESIVLSSIGGLLGIALGIGSSHAISAFARWPTHLSTDSMFLAFGVSMLIGVGFGFYPSWRASRLDPIDCLRYE